MRKIRMIGDDVGWCFQGPLYISIYGRCGCAKYANSNKIQEKNTDSDQYC